MSEHGLWFEGAPHDDRGHRIVTNGRYVGVGGEGRAACRCGALSPVLPSAYQRKAWHREHKASVSAPKSEAAGLTVERREELRRLAEAATPGPWERLFSDVHRRDADYCVANGDGGATAAHIAAFDPPTVLALLDALAAAEAERDEARAAVERVRVLADSVRGVFEADLNNPQTDYARGIRDGATATADDFRAALDTAPSEGA